MYVNKNKIKGFQNASLYNIQKGSKNPKHLCLVLDIKMLRVLSAAC